MYSNHSHSSLTDNMVRGSKGTEGVLCTSYALGDLGTKQPSNLTEARSVDEPVGVEDDMQSDCASRQDSGSSGTESPGVYLFDCAEVQLELSRDVGRCLVDELLSLFHNPNFDFSVSP